VWIREYLSGGLDREQCDARTVNRTCRILAHHVAVREDDAQDVAVDRVTDEQLEQRKTHNSFRDALKLGAFSIERAQQPRIRSGEWRRRRHWHPALGREHA
jgi:hypothetical protein